MKRYRIIKIDYDTRATILNMPFSDSWETAKNSIINRLQAQFGSENFEHKLANFKALGPAPISIITFHNKFMEQTRIAFVVGAYYSSLTSACVLGERILNHLIHKLKDYFRQTQQYKSIYNKNLSTIGILLSVF